MQYGEKLRQILELIPENNWDFRQAILKEAEDSIYGKENLQKLLDIFYTEADWFEKIKLL